MVIGVNVGDKTKIALLGEQDIWFSSAGEQGICFSSAGEQDIWLSYTGEQDIWFSYVGEQAIQFSCVREQAIQFSCVREQAIQLSFVGELQFVPRQPPVPACCSCGVGQQRVGAPEMCVNIDECLDSPCLAGGVCVDLQDGYMCRCPPGYSGRRCGVRQEAVVAFVSTGAILAIIICAIILLRKSSSSSVSHHPAP